MSVTWKTMPREEWDAMNPFEQAMKWRAGFKPVDVPVTRARWDRLCSAEQDEYRRKGLAPID
jgi:hypothetical protein